MPANPSCPEDCCITCPSLQYLGPNTDLQYQLTGPMTSIEAVMYHGLQDGCPYWQNPGYVNWLEPKCTGDFDPLDIELRCLKSGLPQVRLGHPDGIDCSVERNVWLDPDTLVCGPDEEFEGTWEIPIAGANCNCSSPMTLRIWYPP